MSELSQNGAGKTTRVILATVALAMAAACSGPAAAPSASRVYNEYVGASEVAALGAHPAMHAAPGVPAFAPMAQTETATYEYINNDYYTYATIFDYPKRRSAIGYIRDVGGQSCTNALYGYGKKSVWIVAASDNIAEYQVPKKKLKTLTDSIGPPSSCAMNASGDLAVGILDGTYGGYVVVYAHAAGSGKEYATSLDRELFDGYDPQGNLFADGFTGKYKFQLVELPKGAARFVNITTSNTIKFPGSVQWDGKYLTVLDQESGVIYQYAIKGTAALLKGAVTLAGAADCAQTWNAGSLIFCANAADNNGLVFKYPTGGAPIAALTGNFDIPLGTVAAKP